MIPSTQFTTVLWFTTFLPTFILCKGNRKHGKSVCVQKTLKSMWVQLRQLSLNFNNWKYDNSRLNKKQLIYHNYHSIIRLLKSQMYRYFYNKKYWNTWSDEYKIRVQTRLVGIKRGQSLLLYSLTRYTLYTTGAKSSQMLCLLNFNLQCMKQLNYKSKTLPVCL